MIDGPLGSMIGSLIRFEAALAGWAAPIVRLIEGDSRLAHRLPAFPQHRPDRGPALESARGPSGSPVDYRAA